MQFKTTILAILFTAFCLPFSAKAQYSFGIKTTANNAWQKYATGNFDPNVNISVWGIGAALTIDKKLSQYFSVAAEPSFMQRGTKCLPGFRDYKDVELTANYLCLPILFKVHYPVFKNKFFVTAELGENVSYFVSGTQKFTFLWGDNPVQKTNLDLKNSPYNRLDFGLDGGLGVSIPIKKSFIDVGFRYYYGLRDVDQNFMSKNRSMGYQMGYRFTL